MLWWLNDDSALSATAREALADPATEPLVSTASLWEIAIKRSLGKLSPPDELPERISDEGFSWLAISPAHAWQVRDLPALQRDPFDRMLIAQARTEHLPVLTTDSSFAEYGVQTRW